MFSMKCRKIITLEDNQKSMNITNLHMYIYIYIYIYTIYIPILYVIKMTQNKNDLINSWY